MSRRRQHNYNSEEKKMLKAIADKALFDEMYPVIKEIVKSGGGADQIMKKSEPFAAATMVQLLRDEKAEVRMAAAKNIMERASGKAVERNVSMHFDVARLRDEDLDSQIKRLMNQLGPKGFNEQVLELPAPKKQRRKPNKAKLNKVNGHQESLEGAEGGAIQASSEESPS